MTTPLARAAEYFVAPAAHAPPRRGSMTVAASRAAVLASPAGARPLAAALANDLRVRGRAAAALVCGWGVGGGWPAVRPGVAAVAARRLAARLEGRGLAAIARGRIAWLALPAEPARAVAAAARAEAAADVPTVVAIAGPRPATFEPLLAEQQLILVVRGASEADPVNEPLLELAVAGLAGTRATVIGCPPVPSGPVRWLALAGWARLPRCTEPLAAALEGLS